MKRASVFGYYALYLAPIAVAVSFNVVYCYWLVSGAAVALLVVWSRDGNAWHRLAGLLLNAGTSFANFVLAGSLYLQGTGFNAQFFYHLDGETFAIARHAYAPLFFGSWIYWLALCAYPVLLGRRTRQRVADRPAVGRLDVLRVPDVDTWVAFRNVVGISLERLAKRDALAVVATVVCYAPLLSLVAHGLSSLGTEHHVTIVPKTPPPSLVAGPLAEAKNLVLVFAESLEATYSRRDIFGTDLTPRLSALADSGIRFDDIRQVEMTGSTITGLVAALCALPLRSPMGWETENTLLPNIDVPLPGEHCLGDVLSAHGYQTVFMGGAPLEFAGKGRFLGAHGFQERIGRSTLLARLPDPEYRSGWGVHDDTLFGFAKHKLDELAGGGVPFALAMLTLDTHHPSGLPSASCGPNDARSLPMEFAVRCSDRLVAEFVGWVRGNYPETVVALFSDHLAHRNGFFATLRANESERRLRFAVWGPDIEPGRVDTPGTHFDVMPTLLDAIGFEGWLHHNLGASLLRFDSPWFALGPGEFAAVAHALPPIRLEAGRQIVFEARGPAIRIDGRKLLATNKGLALDDAIFAVAFDVEGNVSGFQDCDSAAEFERRAGSGLVVGVSSNDEFNRRFGPGDPAKLTYFAGRVDSEGFVAHPLWWRAVLDVSAVLDPARPQSDDIGSEAA